MKEKTKNNSTETADATVATAQNTNRTLTVLGRETVFTGTLTFSDDLVIAGKFQGLINATGNLEVAKGAVCNVDAITANSVISSGSILPLTDDATDALPLITSETITELCSGSVTNANIKTSKIRIEEDCDFTGNVTMSEGAISDNIFSLTSEEYREHLIPTKRGIE